MSTQTREAGYRCWRCHEFVRSSFQYARPLSPGNDYHWLGICPKCKTPNYIKKPSWDKGAPAERDDQDESP